MKVQAFLNLAAQIATIATAFVAVLASIRFFFVLWKKRLRLEAYLKAKKTGDIEDAGRESAKCTVTELMADLAMTEADVMDAAFRSRVIKRMATPALFGAPSRILLEYDGKL